MILYLPLKLLLIWIDTKLGGELWCKTTICKGEGIDGGHKLQCLGSRDRDFSLVWRLETLVLGWAISQMRGLWPLFNAWTWKLRKIRGKGESLTPNWGMQGKALAALLKKSRQRKGTEEWGNVYPNQRRFPSYKSNRQESGKISATWRRNLS